MRNKFHRIFLIGAKYEIEYLFAGISLYPYKPKMSPFFQMFITKNGKNLIVITGFSKTNASAGAQFIIDHFSANEYVNLGLVGALNSEIDIGDVVQVKECRFHDVNFTAFKYNFGQIPSTKIYRYKLRELIHQGIKNVKLISGDQFITDKSLFHRQIVEYKADCVEVEMASIAHVFYINNLIGQLSSIRTISDNADSNASRDFYNNPLRIFAKTNLLVKKLICQAY